MQGIVKTYNILTAKLVRKQQSEKNVNHKKTKLNIFSKKCLT